MPEIPAEELDEIYGFAIQLAKDAGDILLQGLERRRQADPHGDADQDKVNAVDIVTQTDIGMRSSSSPDICSCQSRC